MTLPESEREELHRRRQEDQVRSLVTPIIEQTICRVWGVRWDAGGDHWDELEKRHRAMDKLMADQARNAGYWKIIADKIVTMIVGALAAAGLYKLGLKP